MPRLYLKNNEEDSWYFKSFNAAMNENNLPITRSANIIFKKGFKLYEKTYGVKLKFDNFGYLDYVEFDSDSDLTMFLLQWK